MITHSCPSCGTIVPANELEANRVEVCPGPDCEELLQFDDLPEEDREYFLENAVKYRI